MSDEITAPTIDQVARLLTDQLPDLAADPFVPLPGSGTTNTIFRIGAHHIARFPRRPRAGPRSRYPHRLAAQP